jgi:glutathione S-transferase
MITVHSIPGSPYGRTVLATCIEKNAPYRLQPITPGTHRQAPYTELHPFAKIPAIEDGDFKLYETQAIIRYIDAAYGAPHALTPKDPKAEARMNQVIGVIDCYFFATNSAATLGFNRVVAPKLGFPVDDAAAIAAIPQTRHCLEVLAGFLGQGPYMAGAAFSLADIQAGCHLELLARAPEANELMRGTPIEAWLERLAARPSFASTTWEQLAAIAA